MLNRSAVVVRPKQPFVDWLKSVKELELPDAQNTSSIGFYRAMGFEVAREAVFDLGGGFVMDDYVMDKRL